MTFTQRLFAILAFFVFAAAPAAAHLKPGEQPRCDVTLYGDSILAAVYLDDNGVGQQWLYRPEIIINMYRPKWRVVNRTQPGQSLYALSLEIVNLPRDTKFVVLESGVIDSWTGEPVGGRLMDFVNLFHSEGRDVILTGYAHQAVKTGKFFWLTQDQIDRNAEWNAAAKYVAEQTNSEFAYWGDAPFFGAQDIIDAVHPGQTYSIRLSENLIAAMDRAAPECM